MKLENVQLKEAAEEDLELLMAWRSNQLIYQHFKQQQNPLRWDEHTAFWRKRQYRKDWIIHFFEDGRWRKVGSINASQLDSSSPEIGLFIGEITLMGKGIGTKALQLVIDWLIKEGYQQAKAVISEENIASIKLFTKYKFQCLQEERDNGNNSLFKEYILSLR